MTTPDRSSPGNLRPTDTPAPYRSSPGNLRPTDAPRTGADNDRWFHPFAHEARRTGPWTVEIGEDVPGWRHTSIRVAELSPGDQVTLDLGAEEAVVVPLTGAVVLAVDGEEHRLERGVSVFAGAGDVGYLPAGRSAVLRADGEGGSRVAVCGARVEDPTGGGRSVSVLRSQDVPVEQRGGGVCRREVRALAMPDTLPEAEQILVCEVITPAGGWSSYPPHKHDTDRPGEESELEEIYYFETQAVGDAGAGVAPLPRGSERSDGQQPVGYQQVYGADPQRPIDVLVEVRTGDVVLVPHGWHGPAMAAPDADLYYLNVMAGPGEQRQWLICDDPAHAAVRSTWTGGES